MTVRCARMLGLARPVGASLSCHASAARCLAPGAASCALKWVAMASAMDTKLPLNMLTPDCNETFVLKTHGARAIRLVLQKKLR
jgi:hypothetical protein